MRCPGQDMRYWKGDAVFEVACPRCGSAVEFFRDEGFRRCGCGHAFPNPKLSFDCARWCEYAEKCLGTDARDGVPEVAPEAAFSARLLEAAGDWFAEQSAQTSPSLLIFQHARQLVSQTPCNGRVVLAAALALEMELHRTEQEGRPAAAPAPSVNDRSATLLRAGLDAEEFARIEALVASVIGRGAMDDTEAGLLHDAVALAELTTAYSRGRIEQDKGPIVATLRTVPGRERAEDLFGA